MAITITAELMQTFRTRFPEFPESSLTDDQLTLYLGDALAIFRLCEKAVVYLTAHLITLDRESGVGTASGASVDGGDGELQSESVGGVSGSWRTMADNGKDTFFTTTAYGRKYITFRNACPAYAFRVRVY